MVVVPASTAAVAGIALGLSKDLLQRAADVNLKERRPVVVCVRETPLNRGTLRHLVELDEAGAVVLPAAPGFYAGLKDVQQLVDFVRARSSTCSASRTRSSCGGAGIWVPRAEAGSGPGRVQAGPGPETRPA